ncbi:MAG: M23/M37 peptidase domain-containing protein [Candidatus Magasanikbacteria bacterium GW2011_GWA2_42_32]|uniref:M23/M37 peptidase domain-containing protein n=1 Tax=Candidatus Magasanikbacteria bacterium GW2011_GWA2_42_32 TaxID=1619039 RepID=A0A0G1CCW4_9BACT|nr:MAG: M23/M37 peptidase domain-containing protein [Candidatus Magasanikbacteria bacterium GW2011_GWA2_42_32]HBX15916.1 hypothetical protein [Candidatus Magasanikbacteria bacterium]
MFKRLNPEDIAKIKKIGLPIDKKFRTGMDWISQPFGANYVDFYKKLGMQGHNGIDFLVPSGTPVFATFAGHVTISGVDVEAGREVKIESLEFEVEGQKIKLEAIYYHLQKENTKVGNWIEEGEVAAWSDNTGKWTTGAHLHFGIKILYKQGDSFVKDSNNGYFGAINPEPLFRDEDYKLLPVDLRYGQPFSNARELAWKARSFWWVVSKLGRRPSRQEMNAWIYGKWDFNMVAEPTYAMIWHHYTKQEHLKNIALNNYFNVK